MKPDFLFLIYLSHPTLSLSLLLTNINLKLTTPILTLQPRLALHPLLT